MEMKAAMKDARHKPKKKSKQTVGK